MKKAIKQILLALAVFAALNAPFSTGLAQGTAFTYQGRLNDGANPANGSYDFRFKLYLDPLGNMQLGSSYLTNAIMASNGLFITTMDFGAGIFTGSNVWLEVDVRTNGAGTYTVLSPLQAVTPTPYAIYANTASNLSGTVTAGQVSGTLTATQLPANVITNNGTMTGTFAGDGANVTNVNAASLNGLNSSNFWQLAGNNVSATQFLGSTNNQAVEIRVNGVRALRLEPNANASPNVIGGLPQNYILPGQVASTIAGGGVTFSSGSNSVFASYATISGGWGNTILGGADSAGIGGGLENTNGAGGAIIGGGGQNMIQSSIILGDNSYTTISGGQKNLIQSGAEHSTIAGGEGNIITFTGEYSAIGGGVGNTNTGNYATIPGGYANVAANNSLAAGYKAKAVTDGTFVWADTSGGDFRSTADKQFLIRAAGGVGINTNNPGATLDVNGSIRVGAGTTVFNNLQGGMAQMASGSSTVKTNSTFTFPKSFSTVPKVIISPVSGNSTPVDDTFAVSVRALTTTTCTVNVVRVDNPSGWSQQVKINWLAWE